MRVYISGPITGVDDYKDKFIDAEDRLNGEGFEVINPAAVEFPYAQLSYEEYMKIDMFLLDMCDVIYLLKGWNKSCGANREFGYAMAKDMVIMYE